MTTATSEKEVSRLKVIAEQLRGVADALDPKSASPAVMQHHQSLAHRLLWERRLLEDRIGSNIFADPARDILLNLIAQDGMADVSISSCCLAAEVPTTTALRWIKLMVSKGLLIEEDDTKDGRRVNVRLSDTASKEMRVYLEQVALLRGRMPIHQTMPACPHQS